MTKDEAQPDTLEGQPCPICHTNNLTLMEEEREIPYFGKVYLFSMTCSNCKFHKADIECVEDHPPVKYTLEISSEDDMNIKVVRSSNGTIKIPHVATIEPGEGAQGFITTVEGVLNRIKAQVEHLRDGEEDPAAKKKAKNILKKLQKAMWGQEKLKLIIEDPTGNSAIISDKAVKSKLSKK